MKKIILALTLFLSIFILVSCGENEEPEVIVDNYDTFENISYKVTNTYEGDTVKSNEASFSFDYSSFATLENTTYDKSLSTLGLLLSTELYGWGSLSIKDSEGSYKKGVMIKNIKAKDVLKATISPSSYETDKDDTTTVELAHYEFDFNNKHHQLFFVVFAGTLRDPEWSSNFDVGIDNDSYNETAHPDWKTKENHKGFDVAANRGVSKAMEYINMYKEEGYEQYLFVCGHSRGASLANIAGTYFTDMNQFKVFTYTYAATCLTTRTDASKYTNIFNLVNTDDLITQIVFEETGMKRYGVDINFTISNNTSDFKDFTTIDYKSFDFSGIIDSLADFIKSREDIYNIPSDYVDSKAISYSSDSLEDAEHEMAVMVEGFTDFDWSEYIEFSEPYYDEEEKAYFFKWKVAPALLFRAIGDIMGSGNVMGALLYIPFFPTVGEVVLEAALPLISDKTPVSIPHFPETYLVGINFVVEVNQPE